MSFRPDQFLSFREPKQHGKFSPWKKNQKKKSQTFFWKFSTEAFMVFVLAFTKMDKSPVILSRKGKSGAGCTN